MTPDLTWLAYVAALTAIIGHCRLKREQPGSFCPGDHLAQLELDCLMLGDRLAHRLAHLRIFGCQSKGPFGQANPARRDIDPAKLQSACCLEKAMAFHAADQIVGWDAIIVED